MKRLSAFFCASWIVSTWDSNEFSDHARPSLSYLFGHICLLLTRSLAPVFSIAGIQIEPVLGGPWYFFFFPNRRAFLMNWISLFQHKKFYNKKEQFVGIMHNKRKRNWSLSIMNFMIYEFSNTISSNHSYQLFRKNELLFSKSCSKVWPAFLFALNILERLKKQKKLSNVGQFTSWNMSRFKTQIFPFPGFCDLVKKTTFV